MTRFRTTPFLLATLLILAQPIQAFSASLPPVEAEHGMVVTSQHYASEIGADILKRGGNAIDAAVAVGYALAVVLPCCGNIGGGGFATIHLVSGKESFINFREKAPGAASRTMYLDAQGNVIPRLSLRGYLAVGVPGTVMGLENMRREYGTMDRAVLMAPAIKLAEQGFILSAADADLLELGARRTDQANIAAIFLHEGKPWKAGEILVQKNLAATLREIAKDGPDIFYKGKIADDIVAASKANGGILTKQDFLDYTVTESAPLRCSYRGYDFASAPPPSSGGTTICEILNILEAYPMHDLGFHSAQSVHVMAEAMRHAYLDRNFALGDPAFVKNPLDRLLSKEYAVQIRAQILPDKASTSKDVSPGTPPHEGTQTTHFSIIDKQGNAVSLTYTLNANFGAKVMAGDTGFLLNDEMDDFTTRPGASNMYGLVQGENNSIAPGKRPLSSMSPTIVTRDGKVFLVLGSPGGSRIITITLETALNVIDYGMNIQEAVDAPRLHHQWLPDQIYAEPYALSPDTVKLLTVMGYKVKEQTPWGAAEAIMLAPGEVAGQGLDSSGNDAAVGGITRPGKLYGATDSRRPAGAAAGE